MADEGGGKAPAAEAAKKPVKPPVVRAPVAAAPAPVKEPETSQSAGRQKLTSEKLLSMSKPEIRAVAHDRGYQIGVGGRRVLAARFLEAQGKDESKLIELPKAAE